MNKWTRPSCFVIAFALLVSVATTAAAEPIPIAALTRSEAVSFEKEILPILQRSCLACHSASDANGELVLESPQSMLKGGDSGPAVVAGKSGESLLLKLAAHQDDPLMPPPGNDVSARQLTPQELGLIKLWIDQGAKGSPLAGLLSPETWRPLPPGQHPIFAVTVSPDGQFVACGRANQIFIYHVATGKLITRLTDPSLQDAGKDKRPGIAHLDVVQSLAFNHQGDMLASGGFRTAKLWRYPRNVQELTMQGDGEIQAVAVSPDHSLAATGGKDGKIRLWALNKSPEAAETPPPVLLEGHTAEIRGLCFSLQGNRLVSASADKSVRVWSVSDGKLVGRIDTAVELHAVTVFLQPPADPEANDASPVERIVTGGADNLVRFWDFPRYLPQPLAAAPPKSTVIAASKDGRLQAFANAAGQVQVIDAKTGEVVHQWQAHAGPIRALAFGVLPSASTEAEDANESVDVAPPMRRLATAGEDGVVRVWSLSPQATAGSDPAPADPPAGKRPPPVELSALHGSLVPLNSVDFHPDGSQLVTGAEDGAVTVWNLAPPSDPLLATRRWESPATADPLAEGTTRSQLSLLSPDGKLLATTCEVGKHPAILIRDIATGNVLHSLLGHEGPIVSLAFSKDSSKLASGSADKTARAWDLKSPKFPEVARFSEHTGPVTAVAFNNDALQVLSGSADHSVKLWNVADQALVMDFVGHTGAIVAVAVAANNQPISASADKTVRVWNPANGQAARTQTESAAVTAMTLSHNGARIAVATADQAIKVYAATGGAAQLTLDGHAAPIHSLAFNADDQRLVSGDAKRALVWDVADGRLLEVAAAGPAAWTSVAYGPTLGQVVLADNRQQITLYTLSFAGAARGMTMPIRSVAWHPAGTSFLAGCADGTVRGFNPANFTQTFSANHGAAVHHMALSSDGTRLASAGENKQVKIWNPANGAALQPAQLAGFAGPVRCVAFSADGQRLVVGSDNGTAGDLRVFHLTPPAGVIEQTIGGHATPLRSLVVGADGQTVSLSDDGTALQWELLAAQRITGHTQPVTSVAAIPPREGQPPQLLSGSLDGTVRRWNALTGQLLAQMNHGAPVTCVAVRSDGERWASSSTNNTIRLWNGPNNAQVALMSGDLRAKALVAKLTQKKNDSTAKVTAAKAVLDAAEKALPVKTMAETTAATALQTADKDVEAKAAVLTAASTKKAAAEKVALEAAAVAQAADRKMDEADKLAAELATKLVEVSAKAERARVVATADPDNQALATLAATAATNVKAADTAAKAAEAAKAAPKAEAAKTAQAAAAAAQAAIALNKPFTDAATALSASQATQRAAKQAHEVAVRDLKIATEAIPAAKASVASLEAALAKIDAELTASVAAEKAAQQPLFTVAFSPDNRTLASGGAFGVVHTWDAETGAALASYEGHSGPISAVAYSGNDSIVSSSADKTAVLWNLNPSWQLDRVIGDIRDPSILVDRVAAVDFSSDGNMLATASGVPSRHGTVQIWNVEDGKLLQAMPEAHTDAATAVAFSPDDQFVVSAGADKYLKKFETASGKQVAQFEGHTHYALGVTWRAGGKILASCGADGTIRIWNAETGDRIRVIQGFSKQVSCVRFIGETQFAVVATGEAQVRKYNMDNGGVQTNYGGSQDFMFSVDSTGDPNNGVVVAGGYDGQLRIWRANGPVLQTIGPPPEPTDAATEQVAN